MRTWTKSLVAALATMSLCGAAITIGGVAHADSAAISTDQADYAPGSLVDLTGSGWSAGDSVHLTVDDSDGQSWSYSHDVVADDAGAFEITFNLPDWFVANYKAVATDAAGVTATRLFTDGNVQGSVLAGTTQVAEPLQVTKYFGTTDCTGRLKTAQVTTTTSGNMSLIGVGGGSNNPQSAGIKAPSQIVTGGHLWSFDHWTVDPPRGAASFDTTANPVCMLASTGSTSIVGHYNDQGPTSKLQQTITFADIPDTTFGAADFPISPSSDSGLTVSLSATGNCTLSSATSPATVHITGAGSCQIFANQAGNATYLAADQVEQDFLISPSTTGVTVTVTCTSPQTFTGSAITPCTANADVSGVNHDVTSSLVYSNNTHVGTASATASYSDANHSLTTGSSTFAIVAQAVPVTVTGSQVYGGTPSFDAAYTLPGGVTASGSASCTKLSDGTTISSALNAGSYTLQSASCGGLTLGSTDYVPAYTGSTFTVTQQTITVTVTGGATYGDAPAFQETDDSPSALGGSVTCAKLDDGTAIDSSVPAGTHTIDGTTCGGLTAPSANYALSYVGGSYVVTKAELTVVVTGSQTYGGSALAFHGAATLPSDVTLDTSSLSCNSVDGGTTLDGYLSVGSYTLDPLSCSGATLGGANGGNYSVVYSGGAFDVAKLTITVGASGTQVYGTLPVWHADFGSTGFVNGEDESALGGSLTCLPSSTTTSAGSHAITSCSGLTSSNYDVQYSLGSLVVSQKPITANVSGTQVYGGSPVWTVSYPPGSFVTPDTASVVSGPVSCTPVDATLHVSGSPYAITHCEGLSATNYAISYGLGTLTVTAKPITIGVSGSQVYGGAPTYSLDYTGTQFANGDTSAVVNSAGLSCNTSATALSGVGTYPITSCSGVSAADYTISFSYGSVTVTAKPITVAVSGTRVYGGPASYTPSYASTQFANGQTSSVVTGTLSCTTDSTTTSNVGTGYHVLTCSGLSAPNYTIGYSDGGFSVTKAPLTVTANDKTMTYGDPVPALDATITGFVNSQTLATSGVSGSPVCTTSATSSTMPGSYAITCNVLSMSATNYSFTPVGGTLTINRKGATLAYSGNLFWSTGSTANTTANVTLQATLTPGSGGTVDLTKGAPVTFYLFSGTNLSQDPALANATCVATSMTSGGVATCNKTLGVDNWTVVASIGNNPYFTAANSDPVVITVYQPATDKFATAGGWVTDPNGSAANKHGNFGFTVRFNKNGSPTGQAVYVYRGADGYDYVIKSNSWTGGGITFPAANTVSFSAKANVTVVDRATGLVVSGLGGGNYTFRVDATDNGEPGSADTYAITVYAPNGTLYHQAGTTGSPLVLGGGNVTVHSTASK